MRKVTVLLDLKNGDTVTLTAENDSAAKTLDRSTIDHIEVRVDVPPNTQPWKSILSKWL